MFLTNPITPNLKLPLLIQNQSGKEVTHNEALVIIDALLNNGIVSKGNTAPPANPFEGEAYIVGTGTGDFINHDNEIAFYNNGWRFIIPKEGLLVWINNEDLLYIYDGNNWVSPSLGGSNFLGINASADNNNRLTVASPNVLFIAEIDDIRSKLSKMSSNNTASHLFQTNYSGRAEFGLIGNDDFTLKVSSDGNNWNDSLTVNKDTGEADFKKNVNVDGNLKVGSVSEDGVNEICDAYGIAKVKMNSNGNSFITGGNIGFGTNLPETLVEVKTALNEGDAALTLNQNDIDEPFVNFKGSSSEDDASNISVMNGDGNVEGPKNRLTNDGWIFEGMVRVNINGIDYWMPYYSVDKL